ncbi:hypothetical protein CDD83_1993 [Cordyceps sp. RAO-2017]|nr:hypothetical protein CDD83_1993 [Cordyceps sp. RAO-2017]
MSDSELRQRKTRGGGDDAAVPTEEPGPAAAKKTKTRASRAEADDQYSPWLDVLRVLSFLLVASAALSYVISGGESWAWGMRNRPYYLRPDWWRDQLMGPVYMTLEELAAHDGRDPTKPLYLAINGTVYDVSRGQHMYGPGGSYHAFAGRDASRAFITTCIDEDNNPDVRGAEEAFLPLDDPDTDRRWTAAAMRDLQRRELERAHEKAHLALKNWVDFFANSPKYRRVGYVRFEPGWLDRQPRKKLCVKAQKARVKRVFHADGDEDEGRA